jgi:hypothetical protein
MKEAFAAIGRGFRLWWREPFTFILLNIGWLSMQIPLITGPAATAALYSAARKAAQDETLSPREMLSEARRLFVPALKWGLLNLLILSAAAGNFYAYRSSEGIGWVVLRALWGAIATVWVVINCFYWPFWFEQAHPTIRQTLFNCVLLLVKRPLYTLGIVVVLLLISVISVALTLPFGAALMMWIALIGTTAVEDELARVRRINRDTTTAVEVIS